MAMGHYRTPFFAALALCAAAPAIVMAQPFVLPTVELAAAPSDQRKKRKAVRQAPARFRRAKGPQAKPRKRSNLVTVSKRVRRKHRRAA